MGEIKNFLKRFVPASSRTINGRLDCLEKRIEEIKRLNGRKGNDANELNLFYLMCKANEIQKVHHNTFSHYQGIHKEQEIVVVGAGPTLKYYSPIKNVIHIGVNGVYRCNKIELDYLFVQDFEGEGENGVFWVEEIKTLRCEKFVGQYIKKVPTNMIASDYIAEYIGAKTYYVQDYMHGGIDNYRIPKNIEFYPVVDNGSTIFAAMQFALYAHPKKIYIVGCDCSYLLGQHFDCSKGAPMHFEMVYANWKRMKEHIETYFPDIEVISINPIGLKGIFKDVYSQSFLNDPEIGNATGE